MAQLTPARFVKGLAATPVFWIGVAGVVLMLALQVWRIA